MPTLLDVVYREYCRARLAEMRKQLSIQPRSTDREDVPEQTAPSSFDPLSVSGKAELDH